MLIMNYQNLKNRQTTNLAVFERFWVVFGLFLWVYCNFSHFGKFSSPKTNYFANYEFSKSEKPPNRQSGGFWAVLGGFWVFLGSISAYVAIILNLVILTHLAK